MALIENNCLIRENFFIKQACGSVLKRLARIEGGTHNDTWLSEGYFEAITHFLAEVRWFKSKSLIIDPSYLRSIGNNYTCRFGI